MTLRIRAIAIATVLFALHGETRAEDAPPGRAVRVGVQVGLVSLPRPADFAVVARFWDTIGLGVRYSFLPHALSDRIFQAASIRSASLDLDAIEAELRVFPFQGAFCIGASAGRQSLSGKYAAQPHSFEARLTSRYVAPRLGWVGVWESGFSMGFDIGAQIPLSQELTTSGDPEATNTVHDVVRNVASYPMPLLALRIGWMF